MVSAPFLFVAPQAFFTSFFAHFVAACPADMDIVNDYRQCGAYANFSLPTYWDNCPSPMLSEPSGLANNVFYPVGMQVNTYLVTDGAGNTANCVMSVTVSDNELPRITCPNDISLSTSSQLCSANVSFNVLYEDNCPEFNLALELGLSSESLFPLGLTNEAFSVIDAALNSVSCSFSVTVEDTEAPVIGNSTISLFIYEKYY